MNQVKKNGAVSRLKRENQRLKRENNRLKKALQARKSPINTQETANERTVFSERLEQVSHYRKHHFFFYLVSSIRASFLYGIWLRLCTYVRRYRMTILILQILLFVFTLPRNGALFLALSALFAAAFPVLLVLAIVLSQTASLRRRREKRTLSATLDACRRVYVFKLPKKDFPKRNPALLSLLKAVSEADSAAVLVISPFLFSKKGIAVSRHTPYYVAARKEANGVFLLRGYFYFSLRRRTAALGESERIVFY